jgi:hypothetical protein
VQLSVRRADDALPGIFPADPDTKARLSAPCILATDPSGLYVLVAPRTTNEIHSKVPDYLVALQDAFLERSHGTTATNNEFDTAETPHDDDVLPLVPFEHVSSYAFPVGSPWPDPPPLYMGQPVYYYIRNVSVRYDKALPDSVDTRNVILFNCPWPPDFVLFPQLLCPPHQTSHKVTSTSLHPPTVC